MPRQPYLSPTDSLLFPPSALYGDARYETPKSPDEKQAEHVEGLVDRVLESTQHPSAMTRFAPRVHAAVNNAVRGLRSGTLERQRARASAAVVAIVLISLGWPK